MNASPTDHTRGLVIPCHDPACLPTTSEFGVALDAGARSCFQLVDGVQLHHSERGQGRTVVILHGMQDSERTWCRVARRLARNRRVLSLDLPGCGLSDRPDASYSLDWQARVVASWLERVGDQELDVIGHSYGGGLAMWLLLYRADCVRRLALVAPGGLGRQVGLPLRLASLPGVVERCGQPWMGPVTRLMTWLHGSGLPQADREALRRMNSVDGSARAFARSVRDVIDWRGQKRHLLDRVAEVNELPAVAFFWGSADRIIPIEHGKRACAILENSYLRVLPRVGHFPHWNVPDLLAQALTDYLDTPRIPRAVLSATLPPARGRRARQALGPDNG